MVVKNVVDVPKLRNSDEKFLLFSSDFPLVSLCCTAFRLSNCDSFCDSSDSVTCSSDR